MPQVVFGFCGSQTRQLELPDAQVEVQPSVIWGPVEELFTPAFWAAHIWQCSLEGLLPTRHNLGSNLRGEVAACLLGGYGIPAEVGLAAYARLSELHLLEGEATEAQIFEALQRPLSIGARQVRYRFARQKASYLAATFATLKRESPAETLTDREFRNWLLRLPGIGLKTASWITRNLRDSDDVAIIDVHLYRAGRLAGVFPASATIERDYERLEELFVAFAHAIDVRPSLLDAVIWAFMKRVGRLAISALSERDGALAAA